MRKLILPIFIAITMHAHADEVVFKCIDAKGNFSYSTQLCPERAKTVAKITMVSTEAKYGKNTRNYRDELRDSQYQNYYYRYEKPNVFAEIAQKKTPNNNVDGTILASREHITGLKFPHTTPIITGAINHSVIYFYTLSCQFSFKESAKALLNLLQIMK